MIKNKPCYGGRILKIDLSDRKIEKEDVPERELDRFWGGRGLSSKMLFDNVAPGVDPFDPENLLIISVGALTGTGVPAASRTTITTKSPLTGMHGDGHACCMIGPNLKRAGFDVVVIRGTSEKPVYLFINDTEVELKDADFLWGKETTKTHFLLQETLGHDISTTYIGPAGENRVRMAGIFHDCNRGANARCGMGAVMGSKKLKAIAVRGTSDLGLVDREAFEKTFKDYLRVLALDPYVLPATKYGTSRFMYHRVKFGIHGANNWQLGGFGYEPMDPEVFRKKYQVRAGACLMCPIRCRREYVIPTGKFAGVITKMEWESIAKSMVCGFADPEAAIYWSHLCEQLGMDVEGVGGTIAFAMELHHRGILTDKDMDGLHLDFGCIDAMMAMIKKIAYREGFGNILADGCLRAARKIGRETEQYAIQVKGAEMSAGDPRGMPVRAVSYATSTRGADHLRSNPYIEEMITPKEGKEAFGSEEAADILGGVKGKGRLLKWSEDFVTVADLLGLCKFAYSRSATFSYLKEKGITLATRFYNACSGRSMTEEETLAAGERVFNVEKGFNILQGANRSFDTIPRRFFEEPLGGEGPSSGAIVDEEKFNTILDEYYDCRGWNEQGMPFLSTLVQLDLQDVGERLRSEGKLVED